LCFNEVNGTRLYLRVGISDLSIHTSDGTGDGEMVVIVEAASTKYVLEKEAKSLRHEAAYVCYGDEVERDAYDGIDDCRQLTFR
jgi:hypothetical protein